MLTLIKLLFVLTFAGYSTVRPVEVHRVPEQIELEQEILEAQDEAEAIEALLEPAVQDLERIGR